MNDLRQWQCWEAQMLGLLKPALMPIQGSVWSCVRLQQDQSRVMPLWGARMESTHTAPEVCSRPAEWTKRGWNVLIPYFCIPYSTTQDDGHHHLLTFRTGVDQMSVLLCNVCRRGASRAHGDEPRETKGLPMVGLIQDDKAAVKGNGSRQCRDSSILPLASSETLMSLSWIWSALFYSVFLSPSHLFTYR